MFEYYIWNFWTRWHEILINRITRKHCLKQIGNNVTGTIWEILWRHIETHSASALNTCSVCNKFQVLESCRETKALEDELAICKAVTQFVWPFFKKSILITSLCFSPSAWRRICDLTWLAQENILLHSLHSTLKSSFLIHHSHTQVSITVLEK